MAFDKNNKNISEMLKATEDKETKTRSSEGSRRF